MKGIRGTNSLGRVAPTKKNFLDGVINGTNPNFGALKINRSFPGFSAARKIIIPESAFGTTITDYEDNSEALLIINQAAGLYRIEGATDIANIRYTAGGSFFTAFQTPAFPTPGAMFTYQPVSIPAFNCIIPLQDACTYDMTANSTEDWAIKGYLIYKKL